MTSPKISVIIPGYNAARTLQPVLASLRAQDWPSSCLEIVYVDDGSTDESVHIACEWADRVVRLKGLPQGPAKARNAGASEASGEILLFLDADVLAPPATVGAFARAFNEDATLDAVFGSYDSDPNEPGLLSQYRNLMHHFVHQTSRRNASTFWAGCGAIRKSSFGRTGGFDSERYGGAMIEDIELGHRMLRLGMQIRLQPDIQVKHLKRWTLFQMIRTDIFSRGIPWMRLLFRDSPFPNEIGDLNLKLAGILSVVLSWGGIAMLILSNWFPALAFGTLVSLGLLLAFNLPIYLFFLKIRGLRFAVTAVPLNILYHLYNGLSVAGALLYRWFFDKPLPGLKVPGEKIRLYYRRYLDQRQEKMQNT